VPWRALGGTVSGERYRWKVLIGVYFQVWCSSSWSRSKLPAGEGTLDPLPLLQQGVPWFEMAIPVLASERGMVMAEEYGRDVIGPWIGWVSGNG
jgi:hypothetical protein